MTIGQAIELIDTTHPNDYTKSQKVAWLSEIDKKVYDMMLRHEHDILPLDFNGYSDSTSVDTDLLIPDEYAEVYHQFLEMKVSLMDRDYAYYNNAATLYTGLWNEYTAYENRNHMPTEKNPIFNFKGKCDVFNS